MNTVLSINDYFLGYMTIGKKLDTALNAVTRESVGRFQGRGFGYARRGVYCGPIGKTYSAHLRAASCSSRSRFSERTTAERGGSIVCVVVRKMKILERWVRRVRLTFRVS